MAAEPGPSRAEYVGRVNRVLDHIDRHLGEPLGLEALARVAAFSPFHFHRVFHALMGESLYACVTRLRLERAATMLVYNPRTPVTSIALDCGFSTSANFARAFKLRFGQTASDYRRQRSAKERKISQPDRKPRAAAPAANGQPPLSGARHPDARPAAQAARARGPRRGAPRCLTSSPTYRRSADESLTGRRPPDSPV